MINSRDTYRIFSDFYDLYTSRFGDDLDFCKTFCDSNDKIIEIGCGTGRVLEFFLESGYEITGIDVSQEMLDKAKLKLNDWIVNKKLRLHNHDLSSNKFPDCFDKALVTFYTFNYIINKPEEFLKNIYDLLNEKGVVLMDLFYPNSLFDKSIDNVWLEKEFEHDGQMIRIRDKRHVENNIERRQQVYLIDGKEIKIDTDRKYFSPLIMKELLERAGFKNVLFSPGYGLKGFGSMIDESELRVNFIVKAEK